MGILTYDRASPRVSAGASRGATNSSMSKPKSTRRMKKSPRRTMIFLEMRCTLMTCKNYRLALIAMTANTASSIANGTCKCTWMQKRRLPG